MYNYKIYPSLLDSFAWYKKSESEESFKEFIDKINRVPFESEAAAKGTAFNDVIDKYLKNDNEGITSKVDKHGNRLICYKEYEFKSDIVGHFYKELVGSITQVFVEGEIEVNKNRVYLYGYGDNLKMDTCTDIKTTSSYTFPKYLHNWQHIVYPYCLNQMGADCTMFSYLVTDFNNIYKEDYRYNKETAVLSLKNELNDLINFLELNRHLITDTKIFGGKKLEVAQ